MKARMKEASKKLLDENIRKQDAALMVGYENPKHFTRAFHNYFGIPPMVYRKKT